MNLKFCSVCNNIYELILRDSDPFYQCKVCGNEEKEEKGSFCIHSNQIGSAYKSYNSLKNKHTIYDPTLPRLDNLPCVNDACFTNKVNCLLVLNWEDDVRTVLNLETEEVHVKNIRKLEESDISSDYVDDICLELITLQKHESLTDILNKIRKDGCESSDIPYIIEFEDQSSYQKTVDLLKVNPEWSEKYGISPIQREVVFMKYDNTNHKYLYMCCTCGASWTNMA